MVLPCIDLNCRDKDKSRPIGSASIDRRTGIHKSWTRWSNGRKL